MMLLPLGLTVALALCGAQAEAPAFRAEVYVIPFYVTLSHGKKPITDLTVANFKIVVDKKIYVPVDFEQDPDKPGHYVVSFKPSDDLRDGMVHNIEVRVKKDRLNSSTKFPITIRKLTDRRNTVGSVRLATNPSVRHSHLPSIATVKLTSTRPAVSFFAA
jgi:hypothetical protein